MDIVKVTEIKASSPLSFEDALKEGILRASKTIRNIKSAWIKEFEAIVDEGGKISEFRVLVKLTFILEE